MIETINKNWGWTGAMADEVIVINEFGNIIFRSGDGCYWRICPEELSCKVIANNTAEYEKLWQDEEFLHDWEMKKLVDMAKADLGELEPGEKYCLKLPAVIGGLYEVHNFGKVEQLEQISFSGDFGRQIQGMSDGAGIKINLEP